jgi:hypothetical protein
MKTTLILSVTALMALSVSATAGAATAPAGAAQVVPLATTTTGSAAKTMTLEERMVVMIEAKVTAAEKIVKQYEDEAAKPDGKRDDSKVLRLKLSAAQAFVTAAKAAHSDLSRVKKEDRPAFAEKYEKPSIDRAVALYMEIGQFAQDKKAFADAMTMYRTVLQLDPQNELAAAAVKNIQDTLQPNTNPSGGGSTNDPRTTKDWQQPYRTDYTGSTTWRPDWTGVRKY